MSYRMMRRTLVVAACCGVWFALGYVAADRSQPQVSVVGVFDDRTIGDESAFVLSQARNADRLSEIVSGAPRLSRQLLAVRDSINHENGVLDQWSCMTSRGGQRLAAAATAAVNAATSADRRAFRAVQIKVTAARRDMATFEVCR